MIRTKDIKETIKAGRKFLAYASKIAMKKKNAIKNLPLNKQTILKRRVLKQRTSKRIACKW